MALQLHDMNWVDAGIVSIIGISVIMGVIRGFVRESLSLVTWVSAIALGVLYFERVSNLFTSISMMGLRYILAFVSIVLTVLIIGGILSHLISRLIKFTGFGATDRIIGTLFGLARGALVVAAAIMLASPTPLSKDTLWTESTLIPRFEPLAFWMKEKIPADMLKKVEL